MVPARSEPVPCRRPWILYQVTTRKGKKTSSSDPPPRLRFLGFLQRGQRAIRLGKPQLDLDSLLRFTWSLTHLLCRMDLVSISNPFGFSFPLICFLGLDMMFNSLELDCEKNPRVQNYYLMCYLLVFRWNVCGLMHYDHNLLLVWL